MPDPVTIGVNTAKENMGMNRRGRQEREGMKPRLKSFWLVEKVHSMGQFSWRALCSLRFLQLMWPLGELYLQQVTLANAAGTNQEG